jgi:hypothetical protein
MSLYQEPSAELKILEPVVSLCNVSNT